ncbi:MAG TPA: ATP-binding protein [Chlamydiales bacterium]
MALNEQQIVQILLGELTQKLMSLKDTVERDVQFPEAPGKIKVAIGMRRAGKTTVVYQHIQRLLRKGTSKTSILYINFEDDRLLPLDEKKLANLVDAFYALYPENHDRKCFLFFDEIQNVKGWPKVIRRLHDSKNSEIFLTGSSAKMLSKEIATSLRGRSLAIEVWPYSFDEFMRAKKSLIDRSLYDKKTDDQLKQTFHQYLSEGGFPEIIPFQAHIKQQTLQEYLDVAIYRDLIERHQIKNSSLIKYMLLSMIHNVSRPFAVNKFYNDVRSQGYQTGKDILYDYVNHIEDAYLAFSVGLYDKSIRKEQTNPRKLYAIDPGMIRATTLDYEGDLGRLFENVVYLDLKRLGCKVSYYLTKERHQIDFLAQTPHGHKKFFQVAWDAQDPKTMEREQRALQAGMQELKIGGEIVTLDSYLREGIKLF